MMNPAMNYMLSQQMIIRAVQMSVREEQKTISKCLPHFAVRMLRKLEDLRDEGVFS